MAGWATEYVGRGVYDPATEKIVDADAVILPAGCRSIPKHYYDVDPAILNRLKDGNRAILHQKMKNWQVSNEQTDKRGFLKGDRWGTKSDPKHWHHEVFPFLNIRTVKAMIADLADASLLVVDGAWCQPLKPAFVGAEQMALNLGKDFQQPRKVFHSSIESESNSTKIKTAKKTSINPRKDAVADFQIPESRNEVDSEIRETRDRDVEGSDELVDLAGLPAELIADWADPNISLVQLVALHGKARINAAWLKAQGYKNRIAGLRTELARTPSPSSAPPPSAYDVSALYDAAKADHDEWIRKFKASQYRDFIDNADDFSDPPTTEHDLDANDTPAIDDEGIGAVLA